jgi:mono/diheme cytochrome c family protein
MTRSATLFAILLLAALGAPPVSAESFPPENSLTPTQKLGRDLFAQHCMVCHVRTQLTSPGHFGPTLFGQLLGNNEDAIAAIISNGTPNMPGFKYVFDQQQIRAIAAYVNALPVPAPEPPHADKPGQGKQSDD